MEHECSDQVMIDIINHNIFMEYSERNTAQQIYDKLLTDEFFESDEEELAQDDVTLDSPEKSQPRALQVESTQVSKDLSTPYFKEEKYQIFESIQLKPSLAEQPAQ